MDLTPGQTISVEITSPPRSAAARKTLVRLTRHDPAVLQQHRRQKRARPSWQTWRRGGRMWHHQMKSKPPVELTAGVRLSLLATVDVIRDLESVERYVRILAQ